jgi:hypothetical protein
MYEVPSKKYGRNTLEINRASLPAADRLGEIGDSGTISIVFPFDYFTELPAAAGISILFPSYFLLIILRSCLP